MTAKFKGYSLKQRKLAAVIRNQILADFPWGYDAIHAAKIRTQLENICSPMFFIKYRQSLTRGDISQALSQYDDVNFARKRSFYDQV